MKQSGILTLLLLMSYPLKVINAGDYERTGYC